MLTESFTDGAVDEWDTDGYILDLCERRNGCSRKSFVFHGSQVIRIYSLAGRKPPDIAVDVFYHVDDSFYRVAREARSRVREQATPSHWMAL